MQDDMFFLPFLFTVVVQNATSQSDSNNSKNILPIVVLHGIASNAEAMAPFSDWLAEIYQRPVYNIEVGNGATTSLRRPMQFQLELLCDTIYSAKESRAEPDYTRVTPWRRVLSRHQDGFLHDTGAAVYFGEQLLARPEPLGRLLQRVLVLARTQQ